MAMKADSSVGKLSQAGGCEAWSFTPDQIPAAWDELEPLVLEALRYAKGELDIEDVRKFLLQGAFAAFAIAKDGRVQLVAVTELCHWPQYTALRIVALAGEGLLEASKFLPAFEAWAMARGAVEIEAWCRPEVSRAIRGFGFVKQYEVLRLDLRSKLQ